MAGAEQFDCRIQELQHLVAALNALGMVLKVCLLYTSLRQAQIGWHEGTEDVVPFIKYLLGIILSAYKDFEDRFRCV